MIQQQGRALLVESNLYGCGFEKKKKRKKEEKKDSRAELFSTVACTSQESQRKVLISEITWSVIEKGKIIIFLHLRNVSVFSRRNFFKLVGGEHNHEAVPAPYLLCFTDVA